jgi:hypothetical protein
MSNPRTQSEQKPRGSHTMLATRLPPQLLIALIASDDKTIGQA